MEANGSKPAAPTQPLVTEVPSGLKQLARFVVRGFYNLEESLIVDMLVRYPCVREDDLCELLKFDKKFLRARVAGLRNDKFLQAKQRIETGDDGKVVKMNCYFINYKLLVNIIKYKLDHMRKKMETSERDATSRSSFKCKKCGKDYTDLQVDQLLDPQSFELRCSYCSGEVDEDEAAGPQQDTRLLLARFNTQIEKLDELLRAVEDIRLAPVVLEPEPVEFSSLNNQRMVEVQNSKAAPADGGNWSGEASRAQGGFKVDNQQVNITFDAEQNKSEVRKELPAWIAQSTVAPFDETSNISAISDSAANADAQPEVEQNDEITSLLLRHEKKINNPVVPGDSDDSDDSDMEPVEKSAPIIDQDDEVMSGDDEEDGDIPTVKVGDEEYAVTDVTEDIIAKMTIEEKDRYTKLFQDFYSHMYD